MKKIILTILAILLAIIVVAVIAVLILGSANMKKANEAKAYVVENLSKSFKLKKVENSEYESMKAYGIMKFDVEQYEIEGVGNLSLMTADAKMMQMLTVVITPTEKDLPLLSCDYMYIFGNRKAYIELYDLYLDKSEKTTSWLKTYQENFKKYDTLPDTAASEAWYDHLLTATCYKAVDKKSDDALLSLLGDTLNTYYAQSKEYPALSSSSVKDKAKVCKDYSDGLIANGGISTDFFKSAFGEDVTRDFFDKSFFGTGRY